MQGVSSENQDEKMNKFLHWACPLAYYVDRNEGKTHSAKIFLCLSILKDYLESTSQPWYSTSLIMSNWKN